MDISASTLAFSARHAAISETHARVRIERVERPPAPPDRLQLSAAARAAAAGADAEAVDAADAVPADGKYVALIRLIEQLTGQRVRVFDAAALGRDEAAVAADAPAVAAPVAGSAPALAIEAARSRVEFEATTVHIAGRVRTAAGEEIAFALDLQMQRFHAEHTRIALQAGPAAQRKDPLVINFDGGAAELGDVRFRFDLDGDGREESLPGLAAGSGFLVFDRNGNGRVDDGRELFGALSGDGFADLAAFDVDGNGWIDGADPLLAQIGVWDGQGRLRPLDRLGVAALSTQSVATPFALRGSGNSDLGAVRSTGVYLDRQGRPGSLQQVDLTV